MAPRVSRWLLWLGLVLLAPMPSLVFAKGWFPAAKFAWIAATTLAVGVTEGTGGAVPLLLLFIGLQAVLYALLCWWVAGLLARVVERRLPGLEVPTSVGLVLAAGIATRVLPIYADPFQPLPEAVATSPRNALVTGAPPTLPDPAPEPGLPFARTEWREPCAEHDPLRRPFFGDTHVHTAYSFDAWGQGTRNTPRDAYRFARGEPVGLQPFDASGRPRRTVQLRRPLDFTMLSDHAENMGETWICSTPGLPGHDSLVCRMARRWPLLGYGIVNSQMMDDAEPIRYGLCGEDGERCREFAGVAWREIQAAAEDAYDRTSACRFTSFVGFEWSGNPDSEMIHRNVLFRNEVVPQRLSNYVDDLDPARLWSWLDETCVRAEGRCDVLAIPHNPNLSSGRLFAVEGLTAEVAGTRARLEVLLEVTQHKGDSECRGFGTDELCSFEKLPFARMREQATPWARSEPGRLSFAREILGEGLVQQSRLGVNPFRLGLIGATDTHFGTPGMADEDRFAGHGAGVESGRLEIPLLPDDLVMNPGGLQAVWAEENSRDALFAAMRRRETYGTSGPRMHVRFFAGDLPEDLCEQGDMVERAYAAGVPMGGELGAAAGEPSFLVWAARDPGTPDAPGTPLQRIQIIKLEERDGEVRETVFEVAGDPANGASVELGTCTPRGTGFAQLCRVWRDPEFDPARASLYYARVVENPTCRWSTWACNAQGVDCADSSTYGGALAGCCDPDVPKTIQERAWTSPIWYTP